MAIVIKKPIVIWGASGHGRFVANVAQLSECYYVAGYADEVNIYSEDTIYFGDPIYFGNRIIEQIRLKGICGVALGFGHCSARASLAQKLEKDNFEVVTLIHPNSVIAADVIIGKGTVIGAGVVIDPGCIIGKNTIINNSATICHDTIIGDSTHVCPGVTICGKVKIGTQCWIGAGATVIDKVTIGEKSFIGAGSIVVRDIECSTLAYGNPAKVVRKMDDDF